MYVGEDPLVDPQQLGPSRSLMSLGYQGLVAAAAGMLKRSVIELGAGMCGGGCECT